MDDLVQQMAGGMMSLLDEYQYWVWGIEPRGVNADGSRRFYPREGFTFEETQRRMSESPMQGTFDDMRAAIEKAKLSESSRL